MSKESVYNHLKKYNLESRIITVEGSSATVKEAALALGTEEGQIAKTMSFILKDKPIVVVIKGDAKVDNAKYRQTFGSKCHMIPLDEVESITSHPVGGVCPFGLNPNVQVYLDISLKKYDMVYPACGCTNNAIGLTIKELEETTNYIKWVDITKDID